MRSILSATTSFMFLFHGAASFSVAPTFTTAPPPSSRPFTSFSNGLAALSSEQSSLITTENDRTKQSSSVILSAVAIGTASEDSLSLWQETIQPVLSAALLITGSTIGATCLVLPETVAGPGMARSIILFVGAFFMNLLSGLVIAEIAMKQHKASPAAVPSSFKKLADVNLQSKAAGNVVSAISVFVNGCVVSFDLMRAGTVGASIFHNVQGVTTMSVCFAAIIASLVSTLESCKLSDLVSIAVMVLFASFAGLLLPGMANVSDPIGTLLAPGMDADVSQSMWHSAPIILLTMIYQNIVPTVTRNLNYDRTKTTAALFMGSFIPLCMYLAWCFTVLGGGIDSSSLGGPLLTVFSVAAVTGSAMGCTMSIAQEVETFLVPQKPNLKQGEENSFSLPSVLLAVTVPLSAGIVLLADGKETALSAAGAYGDPLLYGAIPVIMAWTQRQKMASLPNLVPTASLGLLGVGSVVFLWQELVKDFGGIVGC